MNEPKVALVTGGTGGIGTAICIALAEQGRKVIAGYYPPETNPLFSNDNLERFIRFYNAGTHLGFSEFIGQGMNFFQQQQREFGKAMEGMTGHNPMAFWTDMTQKNIDTWRQMMGMSPEKDDSEKS